MRLQSSKPPIRFPGARLAPRGDQVEPAAGHTPLFTVAPRQEHLLEVRISAAAPPTATGAAWEVREDKTPDRDVREPSDEEKLVLVCLGRRYPCNDPHPQPLTWARSRSS